MKVFILAYSSNSASTLYEATQKLGHDVTLGDQEEKAIEALSQKEIDFLILSGKISPEKCRDWRLKSDFTKTLLIMDVSEGKEFSVDFLQAGVDDFISNVSPTILKARLYAFEQRLLERQKSKQTSLQLQDLEQELKTFSYSVSHDLRAPLRAVDGFSRLLCERYSNFVDAEGLKFLDIIRSSAKQLASLIDDLLLYSRTGNQPLRPRDLDMTEIAKAAFEKVKQEAKERKIEFDLRPLPSAFGDYALIGQVFVNFLSNAIKFTKNKEEAKIEMGGRTEGNKKIYYVRDNGVGFKMEYRDRLFGVFQRLHPPEEFEGRGIGLAIAKRIIHRHLGHVWAESKPMEGATFYFSLPENSSLTSYSTFRI